MNSNKNQGVSPYAGLAGKIRDGKTASAKEFESRKPIVRIVRINPSYGLKGSLKLLGLFAFLVGKEPFQVAIDGDERAKLETGETAELEIEPGEHELRVFTSLAAAKRTINVEYGARLTYWCCPKLTGVLLTKRQ